MFLMRTMKRPKQVTLTGGMVAVVIVLVASRHLVLMEGLALLALP
jgi:hypothetical protein